MSRNIFPDYTTPILFIDFMLQTAFEFLDFPHVQKVVTLVHNCNSTYIFLNSPSSSSNLHVTKCRSEFTKKTST